MREIFKEDFALAGDVAGKVGLARKLLDRVTHTRSDTTSTYVLLREAMDLVAEAGDVSLMRQIIELAAANFDIDPVEWAAEALERMIKRAVPPLPVTEIVQITSIDLAVAIRADHFDVAQRLVDVAQAVAKKVRQPQIVKQANELSKNLLAAKQTWEAAQEVFGGVVTAPDDPAANLVIGRYLCFVKQDWNIGLTHLFKGSDEKLRELAARACRPRIRPVAWSMWVMRGSRRPKVPRERRGRNFSLPPRIGITKPYHNWMAYKRFRLKSGWAS